MDLKLVKSFYRLLDLLESVESFAQKPESNLDLETILSMNQARLELGSLEAHYGLDVKAFLSKKVQEKIAHCDKMN